MRDADVMPHDVPLEQALLGSVIWNNEVVDLLAGKIDEADFYEPIHAKIWSVFSDARKNGRAIDARLATAALGEDAKTEVAPGLTIGQYIARLLADAAPAASAKDYAETIREIADMRRIVHVANDLHRHAQNAGAVSAAEVARQSIEVLDGIIASRSDTAVPRITAGDAAWQALNRMAETRASGSAIVGCPYGLFALNDATLGMARGEMILLGARPSMGKTAFGLSTAMSAARAGHGVLFFSLEMYGDALMERAMADLVFSERNPITYRQIRAGQISPDMEKRLMQAADDLSKYPLMIEQEPGLSVGQIVARSRKLKSKMALEDGPQLDLVVIDHLHLVRASDRYGGQRTNEVTEISGAIKAMAKELGVAVLVLCQLNRGNEQRENKRPQLSDLRDSGALEQDADVVLFLHREEYYLEREKPATQEREMIRLDLIEKTRNILEVAVAKQRQGPIMIAEVFCNIACNAIRDLAEVR